MLFTLSMDMNYGQKLPKIISQLLIPNLKKRDRKQKARRKEYEKLEIAATRGKLSKRGKKHSMIILFFQQTIK